MKATINFLFLLPCILAQDFVDQPCPKNWFPYASSCYRFTRSPIKTRADARRQCQAFNSELASVNSLEEHSFIIKKLEEIDPTHQAWYVSARQSQPGIWSNDGDGTTMLNLDTAFIPGQEGIADRDFVVNSYSLRHLRWGLTKVDGREPLPFICEIRQSDIALLSFEDRGFEYGLDEVPPKRQIPRGPFFIQQPVPVTFDLTRRESMNEVSLTCLAGGYPAPDFEWFKEDFENDQLVNRKIDPLKPGNEIYTVSGGSLIINGPKEIRDRGQYHCVASNKYGAVASESVHLTFSFIGEFNLKRSPEAGNEHWGKAIYCDPPQYSTSIKFYWVRDYFPNFVEEDSRTFVSYDGNLYFSSLENIDIGSYSCNVQSDQGLGGRNGPFFRVDVRASPNYQQLKFPNNFPKSFPEAPVVGEDVRLECIAFGYPVPSYNWTRRGAPLPKNAQLSNFNRVLTIKQVRMEDRGEYVCRAANDKISEEASVTISIQSKPIFTIPLGDMHMDAGEDLVWTCEAFGVPEVMYSWYRNGEILNVTKLDYREATRYEVRDNVLIIKNLDPERDPALYQCKAANQLAERFSAGQLRVLTLKPSFKKRPLAAETYAAEGGNVTIKCKPEAAPRPKITWRKDEFVVGSGGLRSVLNSGSLFIRSVSKADEGNYTCTAENKFGFDESFGRLVVVKGPEFRETPSKRIVAFVNDHEILRCDAVADPSLDLAYVWKHNGASIRFKHQFEPSLDHYNRSIDGRILEIHNITYAQAGEYECVAKTSVGRISETCELVVLGPPGPPGGVQVIATTTTSAVLRWTDGGSNGDPIQFYQIDGRTGYNQTWRHVAMNITGKEVDRAHSRREVEITGVLSPWATYEFKISAANKVGYGPYSLASPQSRTLPDKPYTAPVNVGGGGGKTGDLTITWTPLQKEDQNAPGIYYKVYWRRLAGDNPAEISEETEYSSAVVKDTRNIGRFVASVDGNRRYYYTKYMVKVQAFNEIGAGPESKEAVIYSAEDMPQVAPSRVVARAFNSTAMNISWVEMDNSRVKMRGKLIGYRVKYWRESDKEDSSLFYLSRSTDSWAMIVGLFPNTYYRVRVMAYNSAGEGPQSEHFRERTFKKAPLRPPTTVNVHPMNPSTVRVTWRYVAPGSEEEPLQGYKVRVWESDQDMSTANDTSVLLGNKLEAYVTGLTYGKRYNLRVLAYSYGGDGKMSSPTWVFRMGDEQDANGTSTMSTLSLATIFCVLLTVYNALMHDVQ